MRNFLPRLLILSALLLSACSTAGGPGAVAQAPADSPQPGADVPAAPPATGQAGVAPPVDVEPTFAPPAVTQPPAPPATGIGKTPVAPPEKPAPAADELIGPSWRLVSYLGAQGEMVAVAENLTATAVFVNGGMSGTTSCNRYSANYTIEQAGAIRIEPAVMTMMACEGPRMDLENAFMRRVPDVTGFTVSAGQLSLLNAAGQAVLVFKDPAYVSDVVSPVAGLESAQLRNATLRTAFTASGTARFSDGVYREPATAVSGGAAPAMVTVRLTEHIAYGTLSDGTPAAAAVIVSDPGTGELFYELNLLGLLENGEMLINGPAFIGDRVQIQSVTLRNGRTLVRMLGQGPGDPMDAPSQQQTLSLLYRDGQFTRELSAEQGGVFVPLVETPRVPPPRTSPQDEAAALIGGVWKWELTQANGGSTTAVNQPERYTLEFLPDGKVRVTADCNTGQGTYTAQGGKLSFGSIGMTKMACPSGSQDSLFLATLGKVVSYRLEVGALYLALADSAGFMRFGFITR